MRLNVQPIERAIALASIVLPVPGTSSSSTWPLQSKETITSSTALRLPMITPSTFAIIRSTACLISSIAPLTSLCSSDDRASIPHDATAKPDDRFQKENVARERNTYTISQHEDP